VPALARGCEFEVSLQDIPPRLNLDNRLTANTPTHIICEHTYLAVGRSQAAHHSADNGRDLTARMFTLELVLFFRNLKCVPPRK